ncbi:MAG: hypothetical protein FWF46_05625 [Oscillospiraceae bacterium]|nr:hypothetical protein [Oscillospiraceae bacterium]
MRKTNSMAVKRTEKEEFYIQDKGITLITLVITAIVLLILAGVSIGALNMGLIGKVQQGVESYNKTANEELNAVDSATGALHSLISAGVNGNKIISDGSWNATVNTPKLVTGMTAVYWAKDSSGDIDTVNPLNNTYEITQDDPNFKAKNWYNYVAQTGTTDGKTSRWANAKTADGSYWVWIPRYEYKIDYTGVEQGINKDQTKAGTIDIKFISTNTKVGTAGYTTDADGITRSTDGYIIHPAFTNNVNAGGWDSEIPGIWVAKYEMSMEDNTGASVNIFGNTIENVAIGNVATGNTLIANGENDNGIKAVSKPGVTSWRFINIANCYTNSYNYDRVKESHLMKRSEWGAVAYLTHSQYGRNGVEITLNSDKLYYTGGGNGDLYKTSTNQSSTGNISGVYDLSGGASEYAAVFNKKYSGTYFTDSSYLNTSGGTFASAGGDSTKYVTAYSNGTITYNATTLANFTSTGDVSHIGDGIHEVWVNSIYGWFSDYCCFASSSSPFLQDGNSVSNSVYAGIFSSNKIDGSANRGSRFSCGAYSVKTKSMNFYCNNL